MYNTSKLSYILLFYFWWLRIEFDTLKFTTLIHCTSTTCARPPIQYNINMTPASYFQSMIVAEDNRFPNTIQYDTSFLFPKYDSSRRQCD